MHKIIDKNPVYVHFLDLQDSNILPFMSMIALKINHLPISFFYFPPQ